MEQGMALSPEQAGEVLKALSDPTRLRLLALLREQGTLCVCELEEVTGIAQYTVSRHLGLLRRAGLVENERQGARMDYRLAPAAPDLLALLDAAVALVRDHPERQAERAKAARIRGCCASAA